MNGAQPMPASEARAAIAELGITWTAFARRIGVSARTLRLQMAKGYLAASPAQHLRMMQNPARAAVDQSERNQRHIGREGGR
jgi:hypothetical protein